jgi:predicted Rossmann fold flavoprotein
MTKSRIVIVGGGAAGFFAAITCAEACPGTKVMVLEKGPHFLAKVRISGGGRCNVTHACFDPQALAARYPRGEKALRGPFHSFQPRDTIAWFEGRGVKLKTQTDGCLFPTTDSSQTIIECLLTAARNAGVEMRTHCGVDAATRRPEGGFVLTLSDGGTLNCDQLLLAVGGCRVPAIGQVAVALGHTLEPPVPSLFTFNIEVPWIRELAGVVVESVEAGVPGHGLRERGTLLFTHWGLSGPVILRLSAWGARILHRLDYRFPLHVNWLPSLSLEAIVAQIQAGRESQPARRVVNRPIPPLTARLWENLVLSAGVPPETRLADLSRAALHRLAQHLIRTGIAVSGKSQNKDEFVTCGGVRLSEVDFKTMESRLVPGLHFAGELLDIDGITGGFNFQAAWTTGWLAGRAMAAASRIDLKNEQAIHAHQPGTAGEALP